MIKTLITLLAMGMPFASLATVTPALETKEHKTVYEITDNWEAETEDSETEELSLEEMYQHNYDSYQEEESEDWYDVPIESCPGHEYKTAYAYDGESYFISHWCPYCGDYYGTPITEEEYNATVLEETEE